MAIIKCKYCGGNVSPFPENALGTCTVCGAVMTLPRNTDKHHAAAHNCGNYLRRAGKFDRALEVYRKLLSEDETDAESCWCSALCRFGVQYVEDAENGGYRPVLLRPEDGSFLECGDYLAALSRSGGAVQLQYEKEAAKIAACQEQRQSDRLRKTYARAAAMMDAAGTDEDYRSAARMFSQLGGYADAKQNAQECLRRAEILRKDGIYRAAQAAQKQGKAAEAAALYAQIPGWRDANVRAVQNRQRTQAQKAARSEPERWLGRALRRIAAMLLALALLVAGTYLFVTKYAIPQRDYRKAEALLDAGNREEAIEAFQALGKFRNSPQRAAEIQSDWYAQAEQLLALGDANRAAAIFGGLRDYEDSRERSRALWAQIVQPELLSAGGWFTVALRADRMVCAVGDDREEQCEVGSWMNIASVSAGWEHSVGLRTDGTAVAAGYNGDGRGDVDDWRNIVAIAAGQWHTVGIKSNGRVIGLGCDKDGRIDFDSWRNIIAVSAGRNHTLGLEADYTAVAVGDNTSGQCNVSTWSNLLSVSAGGDHSLGLTRDGKVLTAGRKTENQCDVSKWENIVAISAGYYHSVGLRADGTVVAVGSNDYGQCDVSEWKDIVAISAGGWHTLGLKADGSIVAAGRNESGQCEVLGWENMMLPEA